MTVIQILKRLGERRLRIICVSIYAWLVLQFFKALVAPFEIPMNSWLLSALYILCMNIGSEGNLLIDNYFNRKIPWYFHGQRRIYLQTSTTVIFTLLITVIPFSIKYFMEGKIQEYHFPLFMIYSFLFGGSLLLFFDLAIISVRFFGNWRKSIEDIEALKREKLKTDYKLLQDQLNPHFLFNNFNVLISEIEHNPQTAVLFTRRLASVYRYILQNKDNDTVLLGEEMELIKSYLFLNEVRVGNALKTEFEVPESLYVKRLPPMTLQLLVENAIQHNALSQASPLTIKFKTSGNNAMIVSNNIQLKSAVSSTNTGLKNIASRYAILGGRNIVISKNETEFCVEIPLLDE